MSVDFHRLADFGRAFLAAALLFALACVAPSVARADELLCGRPASRGIGPTASDALFTLTAATGGLPCKLCVCDVDLSGTVRASDALLILRWAVGSEPPGACPAPCESVCLDGIVDPDEECDDGVETKRCDANCTLARCGDGTRNATRGEECDTHGRSATCDGDCTLAACGDGNLNSSAGEMCDDGNTVDGDGCDSACTPTGCGNGIVTAGEECDEGATSSTCDADCTVPECGDGVLNEAAGEQCDDGAETAACDLDCTPAICGDGVVNHAAGEGCEDGNFDDGDGCDSTCTPTGCGNGIVTDGEECDDGGESADCDADCSAVVCGDGVVNQAAGEACEDGNSADGDGCDANCTVTACGNGIVTEGEACDDGGASVTCDDDCTTPACGDGVVNEAAGEACDDGGESSTCDADCTPVVCGDGVVNTEAGEECEDGNSADGDGCDSNCTVTACGNGIVTEGEACDDGADSAWCDRDCTSAECGDGIVNEAAGEQCEDGNDVDGDGCDTNCTLTACGNGVVTAGESCDDGAASPSCDVDCTPVACGDGVVNPVAPCDDVGATASCDEDCTPAACGDGVVNAAAGEECEDDNSVDGDGCDTNCTLTACGNGVVTMGEECDDAGASATCDVDCTAVVCGDGVVNAAAGEECEDGNAVDADGCDSNCTFTRCGNGVVTAGEQCDGGGATETCDVDCTVRVCGDGTRNAVAGEECDRGDAVDGDGCDTNCTRTRCGNGIVTAGEICDDGDASATCDPDCTLPWCGDGTHNAPAGEECDDGGDSATCDIDCTSAECGDGRLNPIAVEACDDGNYASADGCEATCSLTPACGNGNVETGEACDDGNAEPGDGCSESCRVEDCADVGGEVRCLACPDGARPDATYQACECALGYVLVDGDCLDVDECAEGLHACADADRCVNVPGSYSCAIDCTAEAFHAALASCGVPTGVITFACNDTVITIPAGSDKRLRTSHCDDLIIDGLDRAVAFEMDPPCHEIPVTAAQCAGPLQADGTCPCPAVDGGTGFLVLRGARNVVRNLEVRHFYEGVHTAGRDNTVEGVRFERICDDAVGTIDDGVGNLFSRLTIADGCDKCSQSFGDASLTAADPRLRDHFNAIFRDVAFEGCQIPLRMTDGGRYLVERTRMSGGDETLFGCSGPRFTAPSGKTLVVDVRDSIVEECRRGVRFGGVAEGLVRGTTVVGARLRGLLFSSSSRGRVWDSVIAGNGGYGSSEPGFGGVAVTDSARVDLGGGRVLVDGDEDSSPGGNVICNNVSLGGARLDVENLTSQPIAAFYNYWCTLEPSLRLSGSVAHEPFLDIAP